MTMILLLGNANNFQVGRYNYRVFPIDLVQYFFLRECCDGSCSGLIPFPEELATSTDPTPFLAVMAIPSQSPNATHTIAASHFLSLCPG